MEKLCYDISLEPLEENRILMTSRILPTKFFIPTPRSNLVLRKQLLARIQAGLGGKLTLVSAPAGYGKSTLLAEWAHQSDLPVAWFSLDASENDPIRFWEYFVAALRTIPFLGEAQLGENLLASLQISPNPEYEILLEQLVAEISSITMRFALILDDFHVVTEPQIQDGLYHLLESLPAGSSGMHLIVSGRSDPPWPLARMRVHGEMNEVRLMDLRFSEEETSRFLNEIMHLGLPPENVARLDSRTEGWIAGLQMAALSLRGREDITCFLDGFSGEHRFIMDFLVEEVLSQQTREIQVFLLLSSILERLTGDLCAAITGNNSSAEILLQLEKNNMFLIALDDQRNWYRYHHLFSDLLRKQLQTRNPERITELHLQASMWYDQAGYISEAITHACESRDWDFAALQLEKHIMNLIQNGEMTLTRQWINLLPNDIIRARPMLCVAQAWSSAKHDSVQLVEELLAQAAAALSAEPSHDGNLDPHVHEWVSSQIAVLEVVIARARNDSVRRQQELALEALDRVDPVSNPAARATLLFRLGLCYLDLGKTEQADQTFSKASELGRSSGNYYAVHAANYGRMVIAKLEGRLIDLEGIIRQAQDNTGPSDKQQYPMVGIDMTMSGMLSYEWNYIDSAQACLIRGLELVEHIGIPEVLVKGHFVFACIKVVQGEFNSTPNLIRIAEHGHPNLAAYAAALQARIELLLAQTTGDSQFGRSATRWADKQQLTLRSQSTFDWDIQGTLIYGRILHWQNQTNSETRIQSRINDVLDFIQKQIEPLKNLRWNGVLVETYIVMALLFHSVQEKAKALSALENALTLAKPQGFLRTFVDEGPTMRGLLQLALTKGIHSDYVQRLLSAFDHQAVPTQSSPQTTTVDFREQLSKREIQVLRLLNSRLSVPEIAEEIHLAPTTVRTHVQNIYQKLNVHGRIEALQRATELGLL
jgi:LuxR family maltose regulon positive regulatory protein